MKAQLLGRQLFVDDRGHFTNIPLNYLLEWDIAFEGKRVYICDNFQKGTVRGYHYHRYEAKIFVCLKGSVKFVAIPGYLRDQHSLWEPEIFVLSADIPKVLYIPEDYMNAWQSLTDDTILLGISNRTVKESQDDDIRKDPKIVPEYWETKWR